MSMVVKQRPTTSTSSSSATTHLFSPIPACFRRARSVSKHAPSTTTSTSTSVYTTDFGACVLTWTRTLLGRTLRIQLPLQELDCNIKIRSKPFLFWRNQGLKSFNGKVQILWDFRRCRFGSETEAESGFYLAVAVGGELALLIGDSAKPVYSRLRLEKVDNRKKTKKQRQRLVLRKEHASGTRFFRAVAPAVGNVGSSKVRILMEHFYSGRDSGLRISFNGTCVLEVEHLVWKFRGSEQVEYDGVCVNVSWDVYGWLFCNSSSDKVKKQKTSEDLSAVEGNGSGSGVFVFDFEKVLGLEDDEEQSEDAENVNVWEKMRRSEMSMWSSLSSISSSRSSWGSTSSMMDWWSKEEMEMGCGGGGGGFSLVVYATKS